MPAFSNSARLVAQNMPRSAAKSTSPVSRAHAWRERASGKELCECNMPQHFLADLAATSTVLHDLDSNATRLVRCFLSHKHNYQFNRAKHSCQEKNKIRHYKTPNQTRKTQNYHEIGLFRNSLGGKKALPCGKRETVVSCVKLFSSPTSCVLPNNSPIPILPRHCGHMLWSIIRISLSSMNTGLACSLSRGEYLPPHLLVFAVLIFNSVQSQPLKACHTNANASLLCDRHRCN